MHATVPQPELAAATAWTARHLPAKPLDPVLAALRLHAHDGQLTVSAWDGTTAAHHDIDADSRADGTVIVPGRMLADIAAHLDKHDLDLDADGTVLTVSSPAARFELPLLPLRDYPALPSMPETTGTVDGADLAAAYRRVKDAVDPKADGTFAGMGGVRFTVDGERLTLTATDRYRIAIAHLPWQACDGGRQTAMAVLPGHPLAALKTFGDGPVQVALPADGNGTAGLAGGGRRLTTMVLHPGLFPHKLDSAVPKTFSGTAAVDAETLTDTIRRVTTVTETGKPVWLTLTRSRATVRARGHGAATAHLDADYDGDQAEFETAFNPKWLLDGLAPLTGMVRLQVTTPKSQALLDDPDDDSYRYVVIPLRDPDKAA